MSKPEQTQIAGFPALYAKGEGERRPLPLVFLHGFWSTHQFYPTYLPFFSAAGFDCYSVARRGRCGVPPEHARGVRMRDYLEDTLTALEAIDEDVIVIGWSLGGLIAQQVAEAGRCRAAVLVAPAAPGDIHVLPRLAALPGYLRNLPSILLGRPFLPSFSDASRTLLNRIPEGDRRRLYDTLVRDSGIVGRELAITGVPVDAARVRCPMICLVGLEDNITPVRSVRRIARKYGAGLREYHDHAHWLPEEPGWEVIARDIVTWIEAHALAQAASTSKQPSEQSLASAQE